MQPRKRQKLGLLIPQQERARRGPTRWRHGLAVGLVVSLCAAATIAGSGRTPVVRLGRPMSIDDDTPEVLVSEFVNPFAHNGTTPVRTQSDARSSRLQQFESPAIESRHSMAESNEFDEFESDEHAPLICRVLELPPSLLSCAARHTHGLVGSLIECEPPCHSSELSHDAIGLQPFPDRPPLPIELNDRFVSSGFLRQGIELCTGAVWRPSFWVFGNYRTAYQYFDNGAADPVSEWANRLDLFGQLNLTGTERLLVGLRPLDYQTRRSRVFSGYDIQSDDWIDGTNTDIQTLFVEGDFGEIFPCLDPHDHHMLDYGFSVGRQPLTLQDGLLVNDDAIDAVTVTRNTLNGGGILNLRATGLYAWNGINRNSNRIDDSAQMVGLLTETDLATSTINGDVLYVSADDTTGSGVFYGINAIQRIVGYRNTYNTSLHFLGSIPLDDETAETGRGELAFAQLSWHPHCTWDLIYLNAFYADDQFTSAARGPLFGGPVGQTGILFANVALGRYGAPLSNQTTDAYGASIGHQMFFDDTRKQIVFELGGRDDTQGLNDGAIALGSRYQQAMGQHWLWVVEGFVAKRESFDTSSGGRVELQLKF